MADPYLDALRRWMTADELEMLRKELGSPQEIAERTQKVDRIVKRAEHREAIWQFFKMVALAFVTVAGALATVKAILPAGWWP